MRRAVAPRIGLAHLKRVDSFQPTAKASALLAKLVASCRPQPTSARNNQVTMPIPNAERSNTRIVVAKPGLDGHDRGAKVIARSLRDAGFEVIYTGLHQTPEQIVRTAVQEDAAIIGLSILSGAHLTLFAEVLRLLKENDATEIGVFGGGIIPTPDIETLYEMGVAKIFTPGASTRDVVAWVDDFVARTNRP